MGRLLYAIAFTNDLDSMKSFYRDRVGLRVDYETASWVEFECEPGAAHFGLLAVKGSTKREIELCFETHDIGEASEQRNRRGVSFVDNVRDQAFGKVIHARDPEGNLLTILEPKPRESLAAGASWGSTRGSATSVRNSGGAATAVATRAPALSTVIVNCRNMMTTRKFYRDGWGLKISNDSNWWVEFESGDTVIALHPRIDVPEREHHHSQSVTLGFATDDLAAWVEEARARGLHFATSPIDEGFGLYAEIADPDGNVVLVRERSEPATVAERVADEFDDSPQQEAIRKPVGKGVGASRMVPRTSRRVAGDKPSRKKSSRARMPTRKIASVRGEGPEGARRTPKRKADPKRVRNRPAVGRLKKAERKTIQVQKRSVAGASKRRPVKRAVAGRRK